jgi:SAM-dependent methyltransferase
MRPDQEHDQEHWDRVYATKDEDAVSWFEASPERSLKMIEATGVPRSAAIIDIGGGLSRLPDALVAAGYSDITVLDIAKEAIERMTARHAGNSAIKGIVGDLRNFKPQRGYDLWHDRAVLHFMIEEEDRRRYHAALTSAVKPGGHVIIATFAPTGPEKCSGLPVRRYSPADLDAFLGPEFEHREAFAFDHVTPGGATQRFQAGRFQRR